MTVALGDVTRELCERLGVDPAYVFRVEVGLTEATVHLYTGREGFCKGPKYVAACDGQPTNSHWLTATQHGAEPAVETVTIPVRHR